MFSNVKFVIFLDRSRAQDKRVPQGYDSGLCRWRIWFINDTPNHKPCVFSRNNCLKPSKFCSNFVSGCQFCFWHKWLRNVPEYCHMSSLQFSSIDELRMKMYPKVMIRVYVGKESDSSTTCRPMQKACAISCTSSRKLLKTFETSQQIIYFQDVIWGKSGCEMFQNVCTCVCSVSLSTSSAWIFIPKAYGSVICLWIGRHVAISWNSPQQLLEALKKAMLWF